MVLRATRASPLKALHMRRQLTSMWAIVGVPPIEKRRRDPANVVCTGALRSTYIGVVCSVHGLSVQRFSYYAFSASQDASWRVWTQVNGFRSLSGRFQMVLLSKKKECHSTKRKGHQGHHISVAS